MGISKIQWTDYTFNTWWGCARVSPGCRSCYADTLATRWGHDLWRAHGPRKAMSEQYWRQPAKWNSTVPGRVFCGSMCDVFEAHPESDVRAMQDAARARLWDLISATPNLTWQLLTKRPGNIAGMVPWGNKWPDNVWVGTSVEDQQRACERVPVLVSVPAAVRFLSCEPLIQMVDLDPWLMLTGASTAGPFCDSTGRYRYGGGIGGQTITSVPSRDIQWVIIGAESGSDARDCDLEWVRLLIQQCQTADVALFVKQLGTAWARVNGADSKGGDPQYWPQDLRIREFPT